jgi:hypothetical protein
MKSKAVTIRKTLKRRGAQIGIDVLKLPMRFLQIFGVYCVTHPNPDGTIERSLKRVPVWTSSIVVRLYSTSLVQSSQAFREVIPIPLKALVPADDI